MNKRISWIDFGKGFTILLVVFGHVVLGLLQSQKFSDSQNNLLLLLVEIVYVVHIPVFFALSGYFFTMSKGLQNYRLTITKKFLGLGIPYVTFSIVMFLMKRVGGSSVRDTTSITELLNIYRTPTDHLWYLYTLFFIFLFLGLLSLFIKSDRVIFLILIIGFIVVNILPVNIYFIQRFFVWAPIFYFGRILHEVRLTKNLTNLAFIAYALYIFIWCILNFKNRISYSQPSWWGIILPISVILAFSFFQNAKMGKMYAYFVKIGKISLPIYLIHVPVASVIRILMFKVGINNLAIHIIVGLLVAWFFTIVLFQVASRFKIVDFIFYPTKYLTVFFK